MSFAPGQMVGTPRRIRPKSRDLMWHRCRVSGVSIRHVIRGEVVFTVICEPLCDEPTIRVRSDELAERQRRPLTERDLRHSECWT